MGTRKARTTVITGVIPPMPMLHEVGRHAIELRALDRGQKVNRGGRSLEGPPLVQNAEWRGHAEVSREAHVAKPSQEPTKDPRRWSMAS